MIVHLAQKGVISLWTACRKRILNSKLPSEMDMKKQPGDTTAENVSYTDGVEVRLLFILIYRKRSEISRFERKLKR